MYCGGARLGSPPTRLNPSTVQGVLTRNGLARSDGPPRSVCTRASSRRGSWRRARAAMNVSQQMVNALVVGGAMPVVWTEGVLGVRYAGVLGDAWLRTGVAWVFSGLERIELIDA